MNSTDLKRLLDSCFIAKRIVETMPELPDNMKPRHIHVLDAVLEMETIHGSCCVSDVSTRLNITRPSTTKLIQELETLGLLTKYMHPEDKRITLLTLTEQGRECVRYYAIDLHNDWSKALDDITSEQVEEAIYIIHRLKNTIPQKEKLNIETR